MPGLPIQTELDNLIFIVGAVLLILAISRGHSLTDKLLHLLRSLKVLPPADPPDSEQLFAQHCTAAWEALKGGDATTCRSHLTAATRDASKALKTERQIKPRNRIDKTIAILKSPLFLLAVFTALALCVTLLIRLTLLIR